MWNLLALVLDLLGLGVPVGLAPPATWPSLSSDLDCSDKPSLATFGYPILGRSIFFSTWDVEEFWDVP